MYNKCSNLVAELLMPAELLFVQRPPKASLLKYNKVAPLIPEFNLDEQTAPLGINNPNHPILTSVVPIRPPRKEPTKERICRFKLTLEIVVEQIVEDEVAEEKAAEEQRAAEQKIAEQKAVEEKAAEPKIAEQKAAEVKVATQKADELNGIFQSVLHDVGISIHSSLCTATEFLKKHERDKYNCYAVTFNRWLKSHIFFEENVNCFINDLVYMGEEIDCSTSCFQFFSKEKKRDNSLTTKFVKELLTMNFQLDLDTAEKLKDRVKHMVQGAENTVMPQVR